MIHYTSNIDLCLLLVPFCYILTLSLSFSLFSHLLNFCMFYLVLNFNNMHVNVLLYTSENISVSKRDRWLFEKFDVCVHK